MSKDDPTRATNLATLDEAGHRFIVGSQVTKAPIDRSRTSAGTVTRSPDGQVMDTLAPKTGKNAGNDTALRAEPVWDPQAHASSLSAVWAYSAKRAAPDKRTLTPRRTGPKP